jgi:hypothetical protein
MSTVAVDEYLILTTFITTITTGSGAKRMVPYKSQIKTRLLQNGVQFPRWSLPTAGSPMQAENKKRSTAPPAYYRGGVLCFYMSYRLKTQPA